MTRLVPNNLSACAKPRSVAVALLRGGSGRCALEIGLIGHTKWAGQILQHGSRIFIAPDDGSSDVFVHVHDVEAAGMKILVAGQLVAYEIGPARDGRSKAVKLRLLNPQR